MIQIRKTKDDLSDEVASCSLCAYERPPYRWHASKIYLCHFRSASTTIIEEYIGDNAFIDLSERNAMVRDHRTSKAHEVDELRLDIRDSGDVCSASGHGDDQTDDERE